jgi:hypothetical protein
MLEKPDRPQLLLGAETVIILRRVLLLAAYLYGASSSSIFAISRSHRSPFASKRSLS